jgi:hypothetical protein
MIFAKYSFPDEVWEELKLTIKNEEQYIDCAVVELGHICDKFEDDICTEISQFYSVDIMWYRDIPEQFNQYEVFPQPCGIHVFAGCEEMYLKRYNDFINPIC